MRPTKEEYYLEIAKQIASRSTCSRRQFGAVIVKGDAIVATGYNGAVRGANNCGDFYNPCIKDKYQEESRKSYIHCPAIHAEVNAIINAARVGISIVGATIYIAELEGRNDRPCIYCRRVIINSGIEKCINSRLGGFSIELVKDWIGEENHWMGEELLNAERKM